ncbi:MAG: hypothetical protein V7631_3043 [Massilia sp.]|jgi:predicted alpha/beta superfamily hydrolase
MTSFLTSCACLLAAVLACVPAAASAQQARVAVGSLERLALAPSGFIEPRPVEIWLPPDYAVKARAGKRFKVLYMHDGQMLFDATTTWNKSAWNVHEVLARLMREGLQGRPQADDYLRFLVQELKSAVDAKYATRTGPLDTAVMGSSMGG